jgi:ribosomal protein S27AE
MGKTCIQCGAKIGFFQKPVDGIYCSMQCSSAAQTEIAQTEKKAAVVRAEQERTAAVVAEQKEARLAGEQAKERQLVTCPKCGQGWAVGADAAGLARGECKKCGYSTTFVDITTCPSCNGDTLVMESPGVGRCPRCKYRQG